MKKKPQSIAPSEVERRELEVSHYSFWSWYALLAGLMVEARSAVRNATKEWTPLCATLVISMLWSKLLLFLRLRTPEELSKGVSQFSSRKILVVEMCLRWHVR